jgi:magnesium chelatase subunit D
VAEAPQAEAQAGPPGQNQAESGGPDQAEEDVQQGGAVFLIKRWQEGPGPKASGLGNGRRNPVRSENKQGRYVGYRMPRGDQVWDFALDATIRAAAPFQGLRKSKSRGSADGRIDWPLSDRPLSDRRLIVEKDDFREKIRERRAGSWVLFVVDASASMGANKRMKEVKGAILSLLNYSYQKRDTLGLIAFRRESAELLLGFTRSVDLARKRLEALPTGGKTPLARGLDLAYQVLMGLKLRNPEAQPTLVLVSDGRASGAASPGRSPFEEALRSAERIGNQNIRVIILDTENDFIRFHQCAKLNEKMRGLVLSMETLRAEGIVEAVSAYKR